MLPAVDTIAIRDEVVRLAACSRDVFDDLGETDEPPPDVLADALTETIDAVQRLADDDRQEANPSGNRHLARLCDHGIGLLADLSTQAARLGRADLAADWEQLALPYACCAARHGGEIGHLAPVANAAAGLAHRLGDKHDLEGLHGMLDQIVQAASPKASEATADSAAGRAWRKLLLNHAMVANRTQQPALMQAAFDALVDQIPDAAPDFFRECMAQMQAADCPPTAADMLRRYCDAWCRARHLH